MDQPFPLTSPFHGPAHTGRSCFLALFASRPQPPDPTRPRPVALFPRWQSVVFKTGVVELTVAAAVALRGSSAAATTAAATADGDEESSGLNFAHVDGLSAGSSYELRLAPEVPVGGSGGGEWGAYGPPVIVTTGIASDMMSAWPLSLAPLDAKPPSVDPSVSPLAARGAGSGVSFSTSSCRAMHLLVPPAPDCDGVAMEIEWLLPSDQGHSRRRLLGGRGLRQAASAAPRSLSDRVHADSEGGSSGWQLCSACTLGELTPDGQRVVTVAGVSPLAVYEFRARLEFRQPSSGVAVQRFGPATAPVMAGWLPPNLLSAPTVRATSSASFELLLPVDPSAHCREHAGQPIAWEVEVRQHHAPASAGTGGAATWHVLHVSLFTVTYAAATASRVDIHSLRCPSGCDFRLRATNVLGAASHPAAHATAFSAALPPRRIVGAERVELKLTVLPESSTEHAASASAAAAAATAAAASASASAAASASASATASTSASASASAALEESFEEQLTAAMHAKPGDVRVLESRARFGFVTLDLAPGLSRALVDALELRAAASPCVASSPLERVFTKRDASALCERLGAAALLSSIDISAGVLAERRAERADGTPPWVQLVPSLVQDEGLLIEQTADTGGGGRGGALALVLLLAVLLLPMAVALGSSKGGGTCARAVADAAEAAEAAAARVLPADLCGWWKASAQPACAAVANELASFSALDALAKLRGRLCSSRVGWVAPGSRALPTAADDDEGCDDDAAYENDDDDDDETDTDRYPTELAASPPRRGTSGLRDRRGELTSRELEELGHQSSPKTPKTPQSAVEPAPRYYISVRGCDLNAGPQCSLASCSLCHDVLCPSAMCLTPRFVLLTKRSDCS